MNKIVSVDDEEVDNGGAIALKGFNYQNAVASLIAILNYDKDNFLLFIETKDDIEVDIEDKHVFIQVKGQSLSLTNLLSIENKNSDNKKCIFSKNIKKNHPKALYHIVLLSLKNDQKDVIEASENTVFSEEYLYSDEQQNKIIQKLKEIGFTEEELNSNPITKAQFADILQNPFYYGVMYYNKSYFPHIYEKLISKELFDKCTEVRTGKFKRTSKHTREPYIFRGLVRCKHCGCLLSPYTKKGQYVYLRHTDLKNCEHCNNISEKILLKEVEKALASICFDDELKIALADALKKRYEATHGNNHYQLEKNRNQLVDVEENQKKLLDLLIAGTVSAEVYRSKNAEYETAKIELQAKIEQLQTPDNSVERAIDKVLNFSQNSFAIFKSSQIEEKRRILNIVFANFLMDGKNPEISMHKNFKLLSKIGACEDWCPGEDSNFHYLR